MNEDFEKDVQAEAGNENPSVENPSEEKQTPAPMFDVPKQESEPIWQGAPQEPPTEDPEYRKSGVVSMVLGIISAALYYCCCVNIVLAIISLVHARKNKRLSPNGRMHGMAVAGTICSWCSIGFSVLFWGIYFFIFLLAMMTSSQM